MYWLPGLGSISNFNLQIYNLQIYNLQSTNFNLHTKSLRAEPAVSLKAWTTLRFTLLYRNRMAPYLASNRGRDIRIDPLVSRNQ